MIPRLILYTSDTFIPFFLFQRMTTNITQSYFHLIFTLTFAIITYCMTACTKETESLEDCTPEDFATVVDDHFQMCY